LRTFLASVAFVGALTSGASATPPEEHTTKSAGFDCSPTNLARWGARLGAACQELPAVDLVEAEASAESPVPAPLVIITAFDVRVGGQLLFGQTDELGRRLHEAVAHEKAVLRERKALQGLPDVPPYLVSLAITPDVPMARVQSVLSVLIAHELADVQFLFDAGPPSFEGLDPVAVSEVRQILYGPGPEAEELSVYIARVSQACEPLGPMFARLAQVHPQERCRYLARGVTEALGSCQCAGEPDRVLASVLGLGGTVPGFSRVAFGTGPRLDVDPQLTWADGSAAFKDASGQTVSVSW